LSANSVDEARVLLNDLLESAKSGSIIPVRLPGQIEAIIHALDAAEEEPTPQPSETSSSSQAETRAEDAEFLKIAIHELKTPLTSIRGYADMLANAGMAGDLNEMQAELLSVVRSNVIRMDSLLTDLSLLNKIRGGILQVNEKMDMFKNIAQMAEKELGSLPHDLNRQLEFDIPQGLPLLNTDGELFATVLVKLIENGLRYSHEGEGKVIVSARGEDSTLIVTVADNGIGMTEDELKKLGTLFFRADHDLVRSYKGSGVGAAIAYGLLALIKGEIDVKSTLGDGTNYTIRMAGLS